MNQGICTFCTKWQKWQKDEYQGICSFSPSGKSGKCMNHKICAFCTKWQKRQKYESLDMRFLHQVANVANV